MKRNRIPNHVQSKLDQFERQVAVLTQQVAKTQEAIDGARQRLTGGFQQDSDYHDMRATLAKLIVDRPLLENKLDTARGTLADAKAFLAGLPDDAVLEPVAPTKPNGYDLDTVQRRINDAEDEIKRLRAVPTLSSDIEARVCEYVRSLARPTVSGIAPGQQLRVTWPDDVIAILALLLPEQMVAALMKEIERQSNTPMPLPQRKQRIAQLLAGIDVLQRQALALGADTAGLPPALALGVRVTRREETKRVA
jgi:hypothetical protein